MSQEFRFTKNIPTQQKKLVKKRGFTTFETEKIEWNQAKAKVSLQTLNSSKVYFERASHVSEVSPAINTTCDILQQESRLREL